MSVIGVLDSTIPGCIGAADLGDGNYRLDFVGASRLATRSEIDAAEAAFTAKAITDAEDAATLATHEQQAKLALTRLAEIQADATMTNARATQAVRDLAQIVERLVRLQTRQAR